MLIAEIFHSLQGEGQHQGTPSIFIRTSGCNLRCAWCDTPYASWRPEGDPLEVEAILERARAWPGTRHVVLTGGEPLIAPGVGRLVEALQADGKLVTIETSGTVHIPELRPALYSVSPKLSHSTPGPEHPEARRIHLRHNRYENLSRYVDGPCEYQMKFVVQGEGDAAEALELVARFAIPRERVFLMPEGASPELVRQRAPAVADICLREGLNYSCRLHLDLWGDVRGR